MRVLEIRGLEVRYRGGSGRGFAAVDGVDLNVNEGELLALVGESGCGKTSLLRAVAGFEEPVAGTVSLEGTLVSGPGVWVPPHRRQVGMVFQQGALFPHLTVRGNVGYGVGYGLGAPKRLFRRKNGPTAAERAERIEAALELVGMDAFGERYPDELSGGQQQRVALARALAPRPRLVLLDEPFAALDAALRQRLRDEVRAILRQAGATGVLVTHDQEEALSVADLVAVMHAGRVLQTATPEEVYERPASVTVARFLGDGQLIPCTLRDGRAMSVLGSARVEGAAGARCPDGRGRMLVRPEDLAVMPPGFAHGAPGTVVEERFFGHDLLKTVRLEDGSTLQVRLLSSTRLVIGSVVRLVPRAKDTPLFDNTGRLVGIARVDLCAFSNTISGKNVEDLG